MGSAGNARRGALSSGKAWQCASEQRRRRSRADLRTSRRPPRPPVPRAPRHARDMDVWSRACPPPASYPTLTTEARDFDLSFFDDGKDKPRQPPPLPPPPKQGTSRAWARDEWHIIALGMYSYLRVVWSDLSMESVLMPMRWNLKSISYRVSRWHSTEALSHLIRYPVISRYPGYFWNECLLIVSLLWVVLFS